MIDARTQLVGLLGWPVEHSLSPAMHNAAFEALGLNWRYVALPVVPGCEGVAVRGLAALGFRGANVTVPHKTAVACSLDRLTDEARALGAVNTLFVGRGDEGESLLVGHNTDHWGLVDALIRFGFDPQGETAVVVGSGGAARAAVYGLLCAGAQCITVLGRSLERAERLVRDLEDGQDRLTAEMLTDETLVETATHSALLVHATSVGMEPDAERSVWPEGVQFPTETLAYDLVYVPRKTQLLQQANASGARCLGGLGMLVGQGARAFEMWTGREAPVDVMLRACEAALGRECK